MLDFTTQQTENGTLIIRLGGELDAESNEYFFKCVEDEIKNGHRNIVINCSDLGFISSIGLAAFIRARSRVAKSGGRIYLARVNSTIMNVLKIVNLDKIFDIFPKEREAVAAIEGQ
jgi:anti-sigma B factor antagonist